MKRSLIRPMIGFGALMIAFAGCSQPPELSGTVYSMTRGGDVKRAADIDVWIIPATPDVKARLKQLQDSYRSEWAAAKALYADARGNGRDVSQALMGWHGVNDRYVGQAIEVLRAAKIASVRTLVDGSFKVDKPPGGEHFLFAQMFWLGAVLGPDSLPLDISSADLRVRSLQTDAHAAYQSGDLAKWRALNADIEVAFERKYFLEREQLIWKHWHSRRPSATWLVPVMIQPGKHHVELNLSNAGWAFDPQ